MDVAEEFGGIETAYQRFKGLHLPLKDFTSKQLRRVAQDIVRFLRCGRARWRGILDASNVSFNSIGGS